MRILNVAAELLPGFVDLKESLIVDFDNKHWIKDVLQEKQSAKKKMKTVLVALHDDTLSKATLSNVTSSLLVQYFAGGNCGFIKLLMFNDPSDKGHDCTQQLMQEAISVLNQVSVNLEVLLHG